MDFLKWLQTLKALCVKQIFHLFSMLYSWIQQEIALPVYLITLWCLLFNMYLDVCLIHSIMLDTNMFILEKQNLILIRNIFKAILKQFIFTETGLHNRGSDEWGTAKRSWKCQHFLCCRQKQDKNKGNDQYSLFIDVVLLN